MLLRKLIHTQLHIAPLVVFRVVFGVMMAASSIRFLAKGWVEDLYVAPAYHFKFFGFHWVEPLGEIGMYCVFGLLILSAICIALGAFYRLATIAFFLLFTYVELIDATNYLNHYYFISLISLLLIFLPANRACAVDVRLRPSRRETHVPAWTINILKFQLIIVYFFAGIAKLNPDWLFAALPLKIWLPAHTGMPLIGGMMDELWVAYAFSWGGAIFDLSVGFLLLYKRTRKWTYPILVLFHLFTWWLFPIGMFPFIMIGVTLIFFAESDHKSLIRMFYSRAFQGNRSYRYPALLRLPVGLIVGAFFILQLLVPLRYSLYKDKLFWTEQGYRFSWRVMAMEKAGIAFFYVKDPAQPGEVLVNNSKYLTPDQEKQMSTQPDLILQYAKIIKQEYQNEGIAEPLVRAEIWVTLNGSGTHLFADPFVDLATLDDGWGNKAWILPHDSVVTMDELQEMKMKGQEE